MQSQRGLAATAAIGRAALAGTKRTAVTLRSKAMKAMRAAMSGMSIGLIVQLRRFGWSPGKRNKRLVGWRGLLRILRVQILLGVTIDVQEASCLTG